MLLEKNVLPRKRIYSARLNNHKNNTITEYIFKFKKETDLDYEIDVTNIYPRLINLDNTSGIKTFFSIPHIKDECATITIENVEINIDTDDWFGEFQKKNPKNIITRKLNDSEFNLEDDVASVLLRKAVLIIENPKASFLKISGDESHFFDSRENSFEIGDKYIWLAAESMDFHRNTIAIKIIFSGKVYLHFNESDVLVQMIEFRDLISNEQVKEINKEQYAIRELKGKEIDHNTFNNIESKFIDYEYTSKFFESNENFNIAYKSFSA